MIVEEIFQEGLLEIQIDHPKIFKTLSLYLQGVPAKEINKGIDESLDNTRRDIKIGRKLLKDYLRKHSITVDFILDGRSVPRALIGKIDLLFPSK